MVPTLPGEQAHAGERIGICLSSACIACCDRGPARVYKSIDGVGPWLLKENDPGTKYYSNMMYAYSVYIRCAF